MDLKTIIAGMTGTDAEIATALNSPTIEVPQPFYVSYRTLLGMFPIPRVEAMRIIIAAMSPTTDEIMAIPDAGGIDVSMEITRQTLRAMVPGVLTQLECDAVLALGVRMVSPLQAAGLPAYQEGDIAAARGE